MYATGRRKRSVARVFMTLGKGKRIVNEREMKEYFPRATHIQNIEQPMDLLNVAGLYDIKATVCGGGDTGQAGAIRLGISRCLAHMNEENKKVLRKAGFLTRDSREVERKKYGQAKARKRYQFSKR